MISKNLITNFMGIVLCFIPLALLTGPFLPDLFVSITVLLFIYLSIKEKLWSYYNNKFFIFFICFYAYFIVSSLLSENVLFSLESSFFYFRFGIFTLAVWYLLESDKNLNKRFALYLIITFSLAILDGYWQYFFGDSIFGYESNSPNRMTLTFNDKMILGGYLARLYPFLFALMILNYSHNKNFILLIFIFLILIDCLTFLTGERTALGLLALFTIMVLFLTSQYKMLRLITIIISIIVLSFIALTNNSLKHRNIDVTINQIVNSSNDSNYLTYFTPNHQSLATTSIKIYKDHLIFGSGPKQFRILCDKYAITDAYKFCSTHPHNSYLQLASETGTIGILFIIIPFIFISVILFKHLLKKISGKQDILSDYQVILLICIFLTLWPILPTQNFFNNWINVIYYLPLGFLLQSLNKDKKINLKKLM